ncbi:MAG: DegT/DnrJ/EryC1/StrS family aminotransferase [Terriglobia bacterium]|jgi:dTDP-4-amino-4,6-dideoxygalactose transaminase
MTQLAILGGQPIRRKPFPSWPIFDESEEQALLGVLRSGKWWRFSYGEGVELKEPEQGLPRSKVVEFQEAFARLQQARHGIACANGTAAIEIALKALGVGPGHEVIVPAYTFIATASAVLQVNAVPIFVDIELDTLNVDPRRVEQGVTPETKAIIPVHFGGQACDMDALLAIAERYNLFVVEDAAHGHAGAWKGQGLGTVGNAGTFSFQASKNMTAGEGGLITTNDRDLAVMCESYLWAGRKVGRPWYEHYRLGWNYRITEFQAAILLQQLKRVEAQNAKRRENASYLIRRLAQIPGIHPLRLPEYVTKATYHIFAFRLDEQEFGVSRKDFLEALAGEGIPCFGGYAHPLYRNPMFLHKDFCPRGCPLTCGHYTKPIDYASFEGRCPNSERACREMVWLEHRLLLAEEKDMDDIVSAISKICEHRSKLGEVAEKSRS